MNVTRYIILFITFTSYITIPTFITIRYHKEVVKSVHTDLGLFTFKKWDKSIGAYHTFPASVLKDRLKGILSPDLPTAGLLPKVKTTAEIRVGIEDIKRKLRVENPVKNKSYEGIATGDIVATYWDDGDIVGGKNWYLGKVANVMTTSSCSECEDIDYEGVNTTQSSCFLILYMESTVGGFIFPNNDSIHTMGWQVFHTLKSLSVKKKGNKNIFNVKAKDKNEILYKIANSPIFNKSS